MANVDDLKKIGEEESKRLAAIKGSQEQLVYASIDPTAYIGFNVSEDIIKHFNIAPVSPSIAAGDKLFVARRKSSGGTGTKPTTVSSTGAGSIKPKNSKIIGRLIKIPTSGGFQRKLKGGMKDVKMVSIRVPMNMSYPAVICWINNAFTQASKKPSFFVSQSGAKVHINGDFKDKGKLANKKNE